MTHHLINSGIEHKLKLPIFTRNLEDDGVDNFANHNLFVENHLPALKSNFEVVHYFLQIYFIVFEENQSAAGYQAI